MAGGVWRACDATFLCTSRTCLFGALNAYLQAAAISPLTLAHLSVCVVLCCRVWAMSAGSHDTTCLCIRDSELVRMSRGAFEIIAATHPRAAARVLHGMAERLAAAKASRQHRTR